MEKLEKRREGDRFIFYAHENKSAPFFASRYKNEKFFA
jgi:hypothetical protein